MRTLIFGFFVICSLNATAQGELKLIHIECLSQKSLSGIYAASRYGAAETGLFVEGFKVKRSGNATMDHMSSCHFTIPCNEGVQSQRVFDDLNCEQKNVEISLREDSIISCFEGEISTNNYSLKGNSDAYDQMLQAILNKGYAKFNACDGYKKNIASQDN